MSSVMSLKSCLVYTVMYSVGTWYTSSRLLGLWQVCVWLEDSVGGRVSVRLRTSVGGRVSVQLGASVGGRVNVRLRTSVSRTEV